MTASRNSGPANHRAAITSAAAAFFGAPVALDERAYRAFELAGGKADQDDMWHAAAVVFPAIAEFYRELGRDGFEPPPKWLQRARRVDKRRRFSRKDWLHTFGAVYCDQTPRDKALRMTASARAVKKTRRVTIPNMLLSMLESRRISGWHNTKTRTNLAVRRLARDAGVQGKSVSRDDVQVFRQRAVAALRHAELVDESLGAQQYVLYWDGKMFRLSPFGSTGAYQFDDKPLRDGTLWIARGNSLQSLARTDEDMLREFESLINSRTSSERDFQSFLEANQRFLLSLGGYARLHPQVILHRDEGGTLIPDFFAEKLSTNFCDIIEIKRASVELVRHQQNRSRFRDAVMEGVAQLSTYREWFEEHANREWFTERYGLSAFRPRVVLIMGRRRAFSDELERMHLESGIPGWVTLSTYDDVLDRVKQWHTISTTALH